MFLRAAGCTAHPQVGTGGFADVYEGMYKGTRVAVKVLLRRPEIDGRKAEADFMSEIDMLSRLRHPNIGMRNTALCSAVPAYSRLLLVFFSLLCHCVYLPLFSSPHWCLFAALGHDHRVLCSRKFV